jgi:hypothetical protein
MTKRNRSVRRIVAVAVAAGVAIGSYTFGVSSSPGVGATRRPDALNMTLEDGNGTVQLLARKAGKPQQEYLL